jgi:hypothetical protein
VGQVIYPQWVFFRQSQRMPTRRCKADRCVLSPDNGRRGSEEYFRTVYSPQRFIFLERPQHERIACVSPHPGEFFTRPTVISAFHKNALNGLTICAFGKPIITGKAAEIKAFLACADLDFKPAN